MRLPFILALIGLVAPSTSFAVDRLHRCGVGVLEVYNAELLKRFSSSSADQIHLSVTGVKNNGAEWGVTVVERGGKFFVRSSAASSSLWYASLVKVEGGGYWDFGNAKVKVKTTEHSLSRNVALAATSAFRASIELMEKPTGELEEIVLDGSGTMYTINVHEGKCGLLDTSLMKHTDLERLIRRLYSYGERRSSSEAWLSRAIKSAGLRE